MEKHLSDPTNGVGIGDTLCHWLWEGVEGELAQEDPPQITSEANDLPQPTVELPARALSKRPAPAHFHVRTESNHELIVLSSSTSLLTFYARDCKAPSRLEVQDFITALPACG